MAGTKHPASDDMSFSKPPKRLDSRPSPPRRGSTHRPEYGRPSSATSTPRNRSPTRPGSSSDMSTRSNLHIPSSLSATEIGTRLGTFVQHLTAEAQASFYKSFAAKNVEMYEKQIKDNKRHYHDFPQIEVQQSTALADAKKTFDKHAADCDFLSNQRAAAAEAFAESVTRSVVAPLGPTPFEVARMEKLELGLEAVLERLVTTEQEVSALRTENGVLKDAVATKTSAIEFIKNELQSFTALSVETQERIRQLEESNRSFELHNKTLTDEMAQIKEVNSNIEGTMESLEKQIGGLEDIVAMVECDIEDEVKSRVKRLEDTLTTTVSQNDEKLRPIVNKLVEDIAVLQARLLGLEVPSHVGAGVERTQETMSDEILAALASVRGDIMKLQGDHVINAEALEDIQDKVHRVEDEVYGMQDGTASDETLFAQVSELKNRSQDQTRDAWDSALNLSFEDLHNEILLARLEMRDTIRLALADQGVTKFKDELKYLHENLEKQQVLNGTFASANEQEVARNNLTQLGLEFAALKTMTASIADRVQANPEKADHHVDVEIDTDRKDGDDKDHERQIEPHTSHTAEIGQFHQYPPTPPVLRTPIVRSQLFPQNPTNPHVGAVTGLPPGTLPELTFPSHQSVPLSSFAAQHYPSQGQPLSPELNHFVQHFNNYLKFLGPRIDRIERQQVHLYRQQHALLADSKDFATHLAKVFGDFKVVSSQARDDLDNVMNTLAGERNDKLISDRQINARLQENTVIWQKLKDAGIWNLPVDLNNFIQSRNADINAIKEMFANVRRAIEGTRTGFQRELSSHLQSCTMAHNELKIDVQTKHTSFEREIRTIKKDLQSLLDALKQSHDVRTETSEKLALVTKSLEDRSKSIEDLTIDTNKLSDSHAEMKSVQSQLLRTCLETTTSWLNDFKGQFLELEKTVAEHSKSFQDNKTRMQKFNEWQTAVDTSVDVLMTSKRQMEQSIQRHNARLTESQQALKELNEKQLKMGETIVQHGRSEKVMQGRISKHDEEWTELHTSMTASGEAQGADSNYNKEWAKLHTSITALKEAHDQLAAMVKLNSADLKRKDEDIANWMLSLGKVEKRLNNLDGGEKGSKKSTTAPSITVTPDTQPPILSTTLSDIKPFRSSRNR